MNKSWQNAWSKWSVKSEAEKAEEERRKELMDEPVERYNSTIQESERIYRTDGDGSFKMCRSEAWGRYLIKVKDPDGEMIDAITEYGLHELEDDELARLVEEARRGGMDLSDFERNGISLNENFPKIPAPLWSRWIALCFYMCPQTGAVMASSMHGRQLEVQVCLLRKLMTTPEGLNYAGDEWKIVVPKQIVSGVSVKAKLNECIDIETGEKYEQFPPEGWMHAGTSHSHNTMGAFFSGVDDNSELTCPGFHAVIGNIDHAKKQYTFASSIVLRKMRKKVELDEVVDITAVESEFHPDVLDYIDTVVSANNKLYEEEKKKEEKKESKKFINNWSDDTDDDDEILGTGTKWSKSAREHFLQSLDSTTAEYHSDFDPEDIDDLEDLDLYFGDDDTDPNFPYHDEISSIVDNALSQGYTVADILLSLRKAKEEHDAFTEEVSRRQW